MEYYERMKLIRQGKEVTQEEIGKAMGISKQQYGKYENGQHLIPITYLKKFCKYLNTSADYILGLPKNLHYPPFD